MNQKLVEAWKKGRGLLGLYHILGKKEGGVFKQ